VISLLFLQKFLHVHRKRWLSLTMLSYFASLASKESAITFLAIYPLVIFFFSKLSLSKAVRIIAWMCVPAVLFLGVRYEVVGRASVLTMADNSLLATNDVMLQKTTAVAIMGSYLKLQFFPHPLAFDYSFSQIPLAPITDWRFLISFIAHAALLLFAFCRLRKKDPIAFGILFYFITISVSSNLFVTIGTHMAERLVYAPSFGFCFAAGSLLD